jgi:hypothetical protein
MEVAAKFIRRWCSSKMAIAFTLRGSEETDRHGVVSESGLQNS